jgi:methylated-DNA-[protein]-cysteine S-methyltransferase
MIAASATDTTTLEMAEVETPVGPLALVATRVGLCRVHFGPEWPEIERELGRRFGSFTLEPARDPAGAVSALRAYLKGDLEALDTIPVDTGGTDFQRAVWMALRRIPPGRTASYLDLARTVGRPTATRAVGAANGANPVAVVLPCHRVIGTNGRLTGYGGGLRRKEWLLRHEGAIL